MTTVLVAAEVEERVCLLVEMLVICDEKLLVVFL